MASTVTPYWGCYLHTKEGYLWVGKSDHSVIAIVTPCARGLNLFIKDQHPLRSRTKRPIPQNYLIPGQYTLLEAARAINVLSQKSGQPNLGMLQKQISVKQKDGTLETSTAQFVATGARRRVVKIAQLLSESGMWDKRGFVPWMRPDFRRLISIPIFCYGNPRTEQTWMLSILAQGVSAYVPLTSVREHVIKSRERISDLYRLHPQILHEDSDIQVKIDQLQETERLRIAQQRYWLGYRTAKEYLHKTKINTYADFHDLLYTNTVRQHKEREASLKWIFRKYNSAEGFESERLPSKVWTRWAQFRPTLDHISRYIVESEIFQYHKYPFLYDYEGKEGSFPYDEDPGLEDSADLF